MKHDVWFRSKNAADSGWEWAPKEQKHLHPKYVPVFRYARDTIGTLNNLVDGDGSISVLTLNEYEEAKEFSIQLKNKSEQFGVSGKAIQTVCIPTYE
ncbi:MAG: hypothetical protein EA390_02105 [Balneolaceae bacterium]|nr:MAG: hypothetical protein EA390_02105 [Balneolaceae bacterium]